MFFNILTFPLWWYSTGLGLSLEWAKRSLDFTVKKSALRIFLRHFGDTLYGYRSRADRVISFFLRLFLLVFKVFGIFFKLVFLALALFLYLSAVPLVLGLIFYNLI